MPTAAITAFINRSTYRNAGAGAGPASAQLELFVANNASGLVRVYPPFADGNVPPLRTLSDPTGQLGSPVGVAVDACADELFVTNAGAPWAVRVYPRSGGLNQAPLRVITGNGPGGTTRLCVAAGQRQCFVAGQHPVTGAERLAGK